MALFTILALASGALIVGNPIHRKPSPPRLVDALIDGEPRQATLLPPKTQGAFTSAQAVAQDLFGDTRQQQQQALNTTYADDAETPSERVF